MNVRGKHITIVGAGRTGQALARLILAQGGIPFVTDAAAIAADHPDRAALEALGVVCETGGHSAAALCEAELLIPSPGVPAQIPLISEAQSRGVAVVSEMEFAWHFCKPRIFAVTGTNGKTTTTALLHAMIAACGRSVLLAGNNDLPLSAAVLVDPAPEYIVIEVSSYQLELTRTFRPWIAAVLNLTPDHLARHGTMEQYAEVKQRIFARQCEDEVAVVNLDDAWVAGMDVPDARICGFSMRAPSSEGVWFDGHAYRDDRGVIATAADNPLPGQHNIENVLCALTMARAADLPMDRVVEALRRFKGVEHRIEYVAAIDGAAWYNDSKATNLDSLKVALESFEQPIVLIAGGQGKGSDYGALRELVGRQVKALVTLGQDAPLMEAAFAPLVNVTRASDMADAVERARAAAAPGDVVLLSPACASFDMYANFEERGRDFKRCVQRLQHMAEEAAP